MSKRIATPLKTKTLLNQYGLKLKKSLGQNFLIDESVLDQIMDSLNLSKSDGVIEIGPGLGALTEKLAEKAGKVVSVEIDGRLVPVLRELFQDKSNVQILHQDFLKVDLVELANEFLPGQKLTVAANLPYYVTTPILLKLLHGELPLKSIVVMVQKEVASRIAASPGEKDYGSLSIAVQYYAQAESILYVPRSSFLPNPNVDSAVLKLDILSEPAVRIKDETFFFKVVRSAFRQRRKTLFNNVTHNLFPQVDKDEIRSMMLDSGIDPKRRAETLSLEEFASLCESLTKFMP